MTRSVRWAAATVIALPLLYLAACWITGTLAMYPRRLAVHAPAGVALQPVSIRTSDGLQLAAWVIDPVPTSSCVVLSFHGLGSARSPARASWLANNGWGALLVDHRGHGESDGSASSFGWHERLDVIAAIDLARERWPGAKLVGWGESMGAAALVFAEERRLEGLVLEGLYATIDRALDNRMRIYAGEWAVPFAAGIRELTSWRLAIDPEHLRPAEVLARGPRVPLFVATGERDPRAPPADLALLARAAPRAEALVVPGAVHEDLLRAGGPAYQARLRAFFTEVCE